MEPALRIVKGSADKVQPEVGQMLRGQGWVELHGSFTSQRLRDLANVLDENCRGLERKP